MNKKIFLLILIFNFINIILSNNTLAYTSGFEYMINAVGIDKTNINGLTINEDIYNKYNLIVYGNPLDIPNNKQRFKAVSTGRWTKDGGVYKNIGVRGEYMILGQDASGKYVHNSIFPDDYTSRYITS